MPARRPQAARLLIPPPARPRVPAGGPQVRSSSSSFSRLTMSFLAISSSEVFQGSRRVIESYSAMALVNACWSPPSMAAARSCSSLHSREPSKLMSRSMYFSIAPRMSSWRPRARWQMPALSRYPLALYLSRLLSTEVRATSSKIWMASGNFSCSADRCATFSRHLLASAEESSPAKRSAAWRYVSRQSSFHPSSSCSSATPLVWRAAICRRPMSVKISALFCRQRTASDLLTFL
mmetsp:Transcript_29808/g.77057  ORF Transcript_29808/g.77057 Transcript_29808/m.77057 type:complete len:235 (+) Transcript_29808:89-793(+)